MNERERATRRRGNGRRLNQSMTAKDEATGARWCGCAWCCAGNAPGLQPGSAHDICTTNRRPEEDR